MGALWHHDGNPKRPYALLTSGRISNFFFNGSKIIERPELVGKVAELMANMARYRLKGERPYAVVGPPMGAIILAHEVAWNLPPARFWFTEQDKKTGTQVLGRFAPESRDAMVLVVEDVITTGESARDTVKAVLDSGRVHGVYTFVLCIVNRSGKTTLPDGREIIPLMDFDAQSWERGHNPFTGGPELVEPVRPKTNWDALTQAYD